MSRMVRKQIVLEPELERELAKRARVLGVSQSALVREAIRAALAEDEEDLRAFSGRADEPLVAYEDALE